MKKELVAIILCVIIIALPSITAIKLPDTKNNLLVNSRDIPIWADGTFNGTWGLREFTLLFGMVEFPFGNISGYYADFIGSSKIFKGSFYPYGNHSKIANISGIFFRSVIFGKIGDVDVEEHGYDVETNETNYVGIGHFNETSCNWRIISRTGPAFYIKGTFSSF